MDQSRFVSYVAAKEEFYVIKRWQQTFEKVPMHLVLNINQSITLIVTIFGGRADDSLSKDASGGL